MRESRSSFPWGYVCFCRILARQQRRLCFANPATLTGSIGVYMDYTNVEELMGKLGVKNEKIKSGAHKDILSMYRL